jgi:glycosyltransferase involved in cell wall biosynthesis
MKLTIAIPTYNRAKRLEKALRDLCTEINLTSNKANVAVYVSNNGSKDNTAEVIAQCGKLFIESCISFSSDESKINQGFDANVLACYRNINSEYVWFLSDDDNIISGAVDAIINDIDKYHPSVLFYNHDQKPFDETQPYIKKLEFFDEIVSENLISLQKIILWPKLTSLVIKKCSAGLAVPNMDSWFAHVALALQCGFSEGGVLHSPVFTAYPDDDFKDNINFVPYIGNDLDSTIRWFLQENNKMSLYNQLAIPYADPLIACLNTLGAYYRGRHVLTLPLKRELWETVQREMKFGWIIRLSSWKSVKELIKFPISFVYGAGYTLITGKKLTKDRLVPPDN